MANLAQVATPLNNAHHYQSTCLVLRDTVMQFSRDPLSPIAIRKIARDQLTIGEQTYAHTLALADGQIVEDWQPPALTELTRDSLEPILATKPDVLVIGCGFAQARPPGALMFELARISVGLECMDTPAACRTFNILLAEDRRPAAILYLD